MQSISQRDVLALLISTADKTGGSSVQSVQTVKTVSLPASDPASIIIPRLVYSLVFASTIIVAALLIKSAVTGGDCVVPTLVK